MIESALLKKVPGIAHGFGTREDPRPPHVVTVQQVHGVRIWEPPSKGIGSGFARPIPPPGGSGEDRRSPPLEEGYDVVLTDRPGLAVAVKTADCEPILMVEPVRRIVAAVHAGWKGTLARVAQAAVRRIAEKGGDPANLVCALGPNMVAACFEVGPDVAADFEKEFPGWPVLVPIREGKWLLDVDRANRLQLREMGVADKNIDRIDLCTHCRPDLFHSYRRDAEKAGRMINAIELV